MNNRKIAFVVAGIVVLGASAAFVYFFEGVPTTKTPPRDSSLKPGAIVEGGPKVTQLSPAKAEPIAAGNKPSLQIQMQSNMFKLWTEQGAAKSASEYYNKFKSYPPSSTERFLADYKRLSCGSLGSIGVQRYVEFAERMRKKAPENPLEDQLQKQRIDAYIETCKDLLPELTAEKVAADLKALHAGSTIEARALSLQHQARLSLNTGSMLSQAEAVVATENPLALQAMGPVWKQAMQQHAEQLESSIFRGYSPEVTDAAWVLASCEAGMDCSANNEMLMSECLISRRCNAESVLSYYERYVLSTDQLNQAQILQRQILAAIRSRDLRPLGIRGV